MLLSATNTSNRMFSEVYNFSLINGCLFFHNNMQHKSSLKQLQSHAWVRFIQGRFINNLKLKSVNLFEGGGSFEKGNSRIYSIGNGNHFHTLHLNKLSSPKQE